MNGKQAVRHRICVFFPVESELFTMCPGDEYCASMRIILEIFIRRSVPLKANAQGGCVPGTSSGIGAKRSGTRFTKYLTTMLRLSYDNP